MSATRTSHSTQTGSWAEQVEAERSRQQEARTQARLQDRRQRFMHNLPHYGAVALLLGIAAATHGPVFGGFSGYLAAFGGVAVGAVAAVIVRRLALGAFMSSVVVFIAYLLFGGIFALPETALARMVPTVATMQLLVRGVLNSWKDLLTVQPPAEVVVGTKILPYGVATVCAFLAVTIVLRGRRLLLALLPISVMLMVGILWGSHFVPLALPLGVGFAVVVLLWAALVVQRQRSHDSHGSVEFRHASRGYAPHGWVASVVMLLIAVVSAGFVNYPGTGGFQRTVLRDYIEPPLDVREYHSPVSTFRHWTTNEKDTEFFTVEADEGVQRIRLATLDYYDGTIFQFSPVAASEGFHRVGSVFSEDPLPEGAQLSSQTVTIGEYNGHWVPGIGRTREFNYEGDRARTLAESLYFTSDLVTGLSARKLEPGDRYAMTNVADVELTDAQLESVQVAQRSVPADENVPDIIGQTAAEWAENAASPLEQIRAIEQKLHGEGFFSDGTDGRSLPGHRADRLAKLIGSKQMIGDDDQYAPAMALMLRSLGIPSRVVMGFHKEESADEDSSAKTVTFTGHDTHLWVEVPFEGVGWLPFDPTPPRDQIPQTELPTPQPKPRPQVLQPPEPPQDPAQAPPDVTDEDDQKKDDPNRWWEWLVFAATVVGISFLVLLPFVTLVVIKAVRAARRRKRGRQDRRAAAAWEEVIDHATDLGVTVDTEITRHEQASRIEAHLDGREAPQNTGFVRYSEQRTVLGELAAELDTAIFGAALVNEEQTQRIWERAKHAIVLMKRRLPWHRRLRAVFSTKSLLSRREPFRAKLHRYITAREVANALKAQSKRQRKEALAPTTEEK